MPTFSIIEARPYHCGQMVRTLRDEHRHALLGLGVNVHHELRFTFDDSSFRRAWLIDGRLAALGGVTGTMLSSVGFIWLVLSNDALRYPVAIVKEASRQLDEIMQTKSELVTTILTADTAALRLAVHLGFHVADEGVGAPAYHRRDRRALAQFVRTSPDLRIPVGKGHAVTMGYHLEEAA